MWQKSGNRGIEMKDEKVLTVIVISMKEYLDIPIYDGSYEEGVIVRAKTHIPKPETYNPYMIPKRIYDNDFEQWAVRIENYWVSK